jgi:hypothetical protein
MTPMKLIFFTVLFACCFTITAFGQNPETSTAAASQATSTDLSSVTDVRFLFSERETLIEQLQALQRDIDDQEAKILNLPSAETLEQDLVKLNRDLDDAQKTTPPDQQRIAALKRAIDSTNESLLTMKNSAPILRDKSVDKDRKHKRLFAIEMRIASLFDATRDVNQFRSGATWAFTGLVLVVVGGFFFIAYRKDGIASKIFSGEMGMQFVTLFLIVIAIILFGIMGTLEGRELAALLGGLSGYILGKAGLNRQESTADPNPNADQVLNADPLPNPAP